MSITTKDLARICGVSRTTVTRALHGTGRIKEETKQNILETAEKLGYQPDLLARSLVKGTSMTIGVIAVDLNNLYYPKMINAIENRTKSDGYLLNITLHEQNKETELQLIQNLVGHRVDGLIISPANKGEEFDAYLQSLPIPVVMIGNRDGSSLPTVGIDEKMAANQAAEFIIGRGYRNVTFVVPPLKDADGLDNIDHVRRMEGYEKAMIKNGLECNVIFGENYCEQILRYMRQTRKRTAFLCSGDVFAVEVMDTLKKAEYAVGDDYGIMGFDCIDIFQRWSPQLSTVNNHIDRMGFEAAELLIQLIHGECKPHSIEIPFEIVSGVTV